MWAMISSNLADWYVLEVGSWSFQLAVDAVLANKHVLSDYSLPAFTTKPLPLLIICSQPVDYKVTRSL
jgi:hypothetical protein